MLSEEGKKRINGMNRLLLFVEGRIKCLFAALDGTNVAASACCSRECLECPSALKECVHVHTRVHIHDPD